MTLICYFCLLSAIVCLSGIYVTKTTVTLSKELRLGDVLGGAIILAIVTNLPEIAIMTAACYRHELEIGISNILGGIAIQTVVLCLFDFFRTDKSRPLSQEASSRDMILEGFMLMFILSIFLMGHYLPPTLTLATIPLADFSLVFFWIMGLLILDYNRRDDHLSLHQENIFQKLMSIKKDKTLLIFILSSLSTLISGYYLEEVSSQLAYEMGLSGAVFGATILAFVTALPEVSTGLEALFMGKNRLAFSDIFGGNAFLLCLFFPAALYTGHSVVSMAQKQDLYLTTLGLLLTLIYTTGLTLKSKKEILSVGFDTIAVLFFYTFGIVGLIFIS